MSDAQSPKVASIVWIDLTTPEAENTREYYHQPVGSELEPVEMGDMLTSAR
jgi:hypothetical protein